MDLRAWLGRLGRPDRRPDGPRAAVCATVQVCAGTPLAVEHLVTGLSPERAFVLGVPPVRPGTTARVRLALPEAEHTFDARVASVAPAGYTLSLSADAATRQAIEAAGVPLPAQRQPRLLILDPQPDRARHTLARLGALGAVAVRAGNAVDAERLLRRWNVVLGLLAESDPGVIASQLRRVAHAARRVRWYTLGEDGRLEPACFVTQKQEARPAAEPAAPEVTPAPPRTTPAVKPAPPAAPARAPTGTMTGARAGAPPGAQAGSIAMMARKAG